MEIYTFDKSLQERLVEFSDILSSRGDIVPASQIAAEWSYHVELVIEPVGWQALWKIPRMVCQDFEIHYPTIVVVMVEQVYFADLSALVKIVAVQDEIHLPDKCNVRLTELYPTLVQENHTLDLVGTANCIDQLRFFFNYLWMPWDMDDDETADWVALHLETRIRLFFDMKRGVVNKETCDVIRTLVREGREIQEKISRLEETISDEEEVQENVLDDGKTYQLMKLHFRLQQIKTEVEVLENPTMREMLGRNKNAALCDGEAKNEDNKVKSPNAHFVWLGGTVLEMVEALRKIETFLPENMFMKTSDCLQESLRAAAPGDTMIIGDGYHYIRGIEGLEGGGTIKGIRDRDTTFIYPSETESGPSLLDCSGHEILLENVCMDLGEIEVGVIVRKGSVKIVNCKIQASNQSMVKLGVVVLPGAKLTLDSTIFEGLGTALVVYSTGEVCMEKCDFINCVEGVQIQDNASFAAKNSFLRNFKEYAIRLETQKYLNGADSKLGGVELLESVTEVSLQDCEFNGNQKGDVVLKPRLAVALASKQEGTMITDA